MVPTMAKHFGALSFLFEMYRKSFMPLLEGVKFVPYNDSHNKGEQIDLQYRNCNFGANSKAKVELLYLHVM